MNTQAFLFAVALVSGSSLLGGGVWAGCPLPICDVDQSVAEMRAMTKSTREHFVLENFPELTKKYGASKDPAVWTNLLQYSTQSRNLFVELKDEDFLSREAVALVDLAYFGLHQYGPATIENLSETYRGFSRTGGRFQALQSWETIDKAEDYQKVLVVLRFLLFAKEYSISKQDPDWVLREIKQVSDQASARLSQLDPILEGAYSIQLIPIGPTKDLCILDLRVDGLMIGDSMTGDGIVAALMSEYGEYALFKNVLYSEAGTVASSESISSGMASKLKLKIDRESGSVQGTFTSTMYSCTYRITGQRTQTPGVFVRDGKLTLTPAFSEIPGVYEVWWGQMGKTIAEKPFGNLIIREFRQGNRYTIAGSFIGSGGPSDVKIHFQYGYYVTTRAFMVLNSNSGDSQLIRWHLAFRPDETGGYSWQGFGMSILNSHIYRLKMKRIEDLGPSGLPAN